MRGRGMNYEMEGTWSDIGKDELSFIVRQYFYASGSVFICELDYRASDVRSRLVNDFPANAPVLQLCRLPLSAQRPC